jgi:hypothetical protein
MGLMVRCTDPACLYLLHLRGSIAPGSSLYVRKLQYKGVSQSSGCHKPMTESVLYNPLWYGSCAGIDISRLRLKEFI